MNKIKASVGRNGINERNDVKIIQRMLNEYSNGSLFTLNVDGIAGLKTCNAIYRFQKEIVKLSAPDSRVDPKGKTIRILTKPAKEQIPPPNTEFNSRNEKTINTPEQLKQQRKDRHQFVRSAVIESATTTKIINRIMPHFKGVRAQVISGYLNDAQRFWKINYHWEYLVWMLEHSIKLGIDIKYQKDLSHLLSRLKNCSPTPDSGYRTSAKVGFPADKSSMLQMDQRYSIVCQTKREFHHLINKTQLMKYSDRSPKCFHLATAPVAHPGKSKHASGYALDIEGDNAIIKSIAKRIGATVVFDERSHVHTEFKNG